MDNKVTDSLEKGEVYTKAIYEEKIEGKDCYKIYTLNGEKLIDCLPVCLVRASKFGDSRISSEDYRRLNVWYDDYIFKNQKYDF